MGLEGRQTRSVGRVAAEPPQSPVSGAAGNAPKLFLMVYRSVAVQGKFLRRTRPKPVRTQNSRALRREIQLFFKNSCRLLINIEKTLDRLAGLWYNKRID
jgi:hypothetical protein